MANRKDKSVKFYIRYNRVHYWTKINAIKNIEARQLGSDIEYMVSTNIAHNVKCDCKGLRGSGELTIDNACEQHQPLLLNIILSCPNLEEIRRNEQDFWRARSRFGGDVQNALALFRGRNKTYDYTIYNDDNKEQFVDEFISYLREELKSDD